MRLRAVTLVVQRGYPEQHSSRQKKAAIAVGSKNRRFLQGDSF